MFFFFFQAEDGIRDSSVTGVQTCALPISKSGTNEIHGQGFYFIRDNALGATNPFTTIPQLLNGPTQNVPIKPDDRRHQFGGVVGGPLIRDKLFYLLSYDGLQRNFPAVATTSSPNSLILTPAQTATPT